MKINSFLLERYLAKYEFCAPHLLCTSDCQSLTAGELLEICGESPEAYVNVWLGYTESRGSPSLRKAISSLYDSVTPDDIITFSGAQEGIFVFMNVLLSQGDHVIVQYPGYQSLYEVANAIQCEVTLWEMDDKCGWKPDIGDLKRSIKPSTKAIVLNTPHNPTGYNFSKDELSEIVKIASENSLYLFCDEVYRELEHDKSGRLPAVADLYSKGVSLGVMSKAYGLAGLRVGWIAAKDSHLIEKIANYKDFTTICSSAPSEYLAEIALKNREKLTERNLNIISENLLLLDTFFKKYSAVFEWVRPNAGSIGFVRIKTGEDADKFCLDAIEKSGVLLLPSTVYNYKNSHFRIGFGRTDMKDALLRFEEYLKKRDNLE